MFHHGSLLQEGFVTWGQYRRGRKAVSNARIAQSAQWTRLSRLCTATLQRRLRLNKSRHETDVVGFGATTAQPLWSRIRRTIHYKRDDRLPCHRFANA